jgi:hypothetical protein
LTVKFAYSDLAIIPMPTNLERFKSDLSKLISVGWDMYSELTDRICALEENKDDYEGSFEENYQRWYTEASAVLKQLMPDRLPEFSHLYHGDGKRKQIRRTRKRSEYCPIIKILTIPRCTSIIHMRK